MGLPLDADARAVARRLGRGSSDLPIDVLPLSTRARNCLRRAGITTLRELVQRTLEDLLRIPGFGAGCLAEVSRAVDQPGQAPRTVAERRSRVSLPWPVVIDEPLLERAFDQLLAWAEVPSARRAALAARLGWPDGRACSLQEAGDLVGVTRERMRQIQMKFEGRIRGRVTIPVLERALAIIQENLPTTADRVSEALLEHELSERSIHPVALARLAGILGVEPGFEVVSLDALGDVVVTAGEASRVQGLKRARGDLKRAARPYGFIHIDLARTIVAKILGDPEVVEPALQAARAEPLQAGWYYVQTDDREPAIRLIEDMLAVAGGALPASEIREGFERRLRWRGAAGHHDQEGWYPSVEALLAFCRARHDRFRVEGDVVRSTQPLHFEQRIVGVERTMVKVLLDAPGRVLRREDFEREVVGRGVNVNTFSVYTSYSPFIRELGGGLWAVRGVEPDPIEVERLRRRRRTRRRRIEGWGWLPSGVLRVSVRLARTTNVVIGIPGAVRPYLSGRTFAIVLPDGTRKGTVRVDEVGASWGYGPALGRLGAEVGALMLADFDLATGTVALSLASSDDEGTASDA
ncbi:DNA-directed RNA polymerase subunit alpha [bacterium HR12]|nr:DNA-directed RNA polymerase subunit alpha [bacterium HR12]